MRTDGANKSSIIIIAIGSRFSIHKPPLISSKDPSLGGLSKNPRKDDFPVAQPSAIKRLKKLTLPAQVAFYGEPGRYYVNESSFQSQSSLAASCQPPRMEMQIMKPGMGGAVVGTRLGSMFAAVGCKDMLSRQRNLSLVKRRLGASGSWSIVNNGGE